MRVVLSQGLLYFLTLKPTKCNKVASNIHYTGSVIAVPKWEGHMYIVQAPNESTPSSNQFEKEVRREPKSRV